MSRRRRTDAGFTLLECEVALLVLAVLLLGLFRLTTDHERLLATLERFGAEPVTLHARPHADPLARALGRPAALLDAAPREPAPRVPRADEPGLQVLEHGRDLLARTSWARVRPPDPDRGRADDADEDDER